jgi:uncharacterized DUF497 family protein
MIDRHRITGFDRDGRNARKNEKHGVSQADAEQVFFNEPLVVLADIGHSSHEPRFHALGATDEGRLLHTTFTLRSDNTRLRVISARDMHLKERAVYEKTR